MLSAKFFEFIQHKFPSVYCWNKRIKHVFLLDFEVKGHSILFENIKRQDGNQQIHFIGVPVIIMGMKRLDCVHGMDPCISSKRKRMENKIKEVISVVLW